jgi:drug/metabolite transporter (DMT)-like permease
VTTTTDAPDTGTTSAPAPWLPLAACGVTLVIWASAFVVIRHVAEDVSPGALGAGRLLVAALVVLPLVLRRGWVRPTSREWALLAVGGVGWFGIYNLALNAGERHVDAGTAMLVGFAGVAVIARGSTTDADASLVGVLLVLVAAAMYAVGVLTQKVLLRRIPSVQVVFVSFLMGAATCLPFSSDLPGIVADGGAELWWIVYLGVLPTAVAFTTWAYALTHTDAGKLSLTTFLVPGIATVIAWLLIDEVPPSLTFLGGALAIVGVLMTRRKPVVRA